MRVANKTYVLEGTLLEACSCRAPCPCWIGGEPDDSACNTVIAYRIERGSIGGINVSDLSLVQVGVIPGTALTGNWRMVVYVDDRAGPEQRGALLDAWTGKLGGPLADLAQLVGEWIAIYAAPIEHRLMGGKGSLRAGGVVSAELELCRDATGRPTTLHDSIFSTIPGSPANLARASKYRVYIPEHGLEWGYTRRNGVHGNFHFAV
jgi:hypothetical protein